MIELHHFYYEQLPTLYTKGISQLHPKGGEKRCCSFGSHAKKRKRSSRRDLMHSNSNKIVAVNGQNHRQTSTSRSSDIQVQIIRLFKKRGETQVQLFLNFNQTLAQAQLNRKTSASN
jgi:hypothetical protein